MKVKPIDSSGFRRRTGARRARGWGGRLLRLGLVAGALAGCARKRAAPEAPAASAPPAAEAPTSAPGEEVSVLDVNGDGRPDVWTYRAGGADGGLPVRKELDIDWDGTVDLTLTYGAREGTQREAMDGDLDGRVDSVAHYEEERLVRRERDTDEDGRMDLWEEWEEGRPVRLGEDTDGDGQPERWTRPAGAPAAPEAPPERR